MARARLLDVPGDEPRQAPARRRCASTSNRNFEGRQGAGGRTHLMSPVMAAAAAIVGKLADVRDLADRNPTPRKASPKPVGEPHVDERVETDDDEREKIGDQPEDSATSPHTNTIAAHSATAGLPKFEVWKGFAAPLDRSNVDTDAII